MKPSGKTCAACGETYGPDVLFCPVDGTPLSGPRSLAGSALEVDPYLGLDLAGSIKLDALVGVGSMGRVYRAFQGGVDRDVAVKVLHRELTGNAELVARFHREAKIASRLVHPNVVQVLMTGVIPGGGDARTGGEVYLAMEYLDGISLLSALHAQGEGGALPLARSLHIILQICDAVGEAHAQGIVHRDIKPENIMLVRRGEDPDFVKVLDFGIARIDWAAEAESTQAGLIFGTAKYISPEGAEGKPVGPQADVYAIATMLYQCLAGRAPFEGDSPMSLLVQQIHAPPADLSSIARAAYVPAALAQVVMGNLSKNAEERAKNARELGREIHLAARDAGIAVDTLHGASKGQLRLASKQRTKQHEFTPELRAKIDSIPDPSRSGSAPPSVTEIVDPTENGAPSLGSPPAPPRPGASQPPARGSRPGSSVPPIAGMTQVADEDATIHGSLDHEDDGVAAEPGPTIPGAPIDSPAPRASAPTLGGEPLPSPRRSHAGGSGPPASSPSDGVAELEYDADAATRARRTRWALAIAAILAIAPVVAYGAVRWLGPTADATAVDQAIARAESAMQRRAWDAPPGENVKELTDRALERSPGDRRILSLRRTAAEQIVNDALGRKYAGSQADALRLAKLALELAPDLTTAQHLVRELQASEISPAIAPASASSPTTAAPTSVVRAGPIGTRASAATPSPSAAPSEGPSLPPAPPPDLTPPPPSSARPWL